jgi:hypothetical protein
MTAMTETLGKEMAQETLLVLVQECQLKRLTDYLFLIPDENRDIKQRWLARFLQGKSLPTPPQADTIARMLETEGDVSRLWENRSLQQFFEQDPNARLRLAFLKVRYDFFKEKHSVPDLRDVREQTMVECLQSLDAPAQPTPGQEEFAFRVLTRFLQTQKSGWKRELSEKWKSLLRRLHRSGQLTVEIGKECEAVLSRFPAGEDWNEISSLLGSRRKTGQMMGFLRDHIGGSSGPAGVAMGLLLPVSKEEFQKLRGLVSKIMRESGPKDDQPDAFIVLVLFSIHPNVESTDLQLVLNSVPLTQKQKERLWTTASRLASPDRKRMIADCLGPDAVLGGSLDDLVSVLKDVVERVSPDWRGDLPSDPLIASKLEILASFLDEGSIKVFGLTLANSISTRLRDAAARIRRPRHPEPHK